MQSGKEHISTRPGNLVGAVSRAVLPAFLAALVVGFFAYEPALKGPFVFDDYALPFRFPGFRSESFLNWISSVRPVLMASYWLNFQMSGQESTLSYHLLNLIIHAANSVLVGVILLRLLKLTPAKSEYQLLLAVAGAGVFLLHPLQSESVAYIAGRSESLSAFFALCAFALFLYKRDSPIQWRTAILILLFFGAAAATKEHAVALVGVFLLTDMFFQSSLTFDGVRRNWRLYVPLVIGGVFATVAAFRVLAVSESAGFSMRGLSSYEYALTQARVLWKCVSLFVMPVGLTVDHDFSISRSLLDHGSIVAIIMWLAAAVAAFVYRRRYPLACYGLLLFLILLAPTSSVIPIKDVIAERRLYLPLLGLLLIVLDAVSRLQASRTSVIGVSACLLIVLGIATHQRSEAWGDSEKLWQSAIAATPTKARPYANLASLYLAKRQCGPGLELIQKAESAMGKIDDAYLLTIWGLTLECTGDQAGALAKMEASTAKEPNAQALAVLGRMYLAAGKPAEAEQALAKAEQLNPQWELTYVYRARLLMERNEPEAASVQLQRALQLNPANQMAQQLMSQLATRSRSRTSP